MLKLLFNLDRVPLYPAPIAWKVITPCTWQLSFANDAGAVQALINAGAGALTPNGAGETPIALFTSRYEQTVLNFGQADPVLTAMANAFNLQFEAVGTAQNNLCSISWLQSATEASMEAVVQTQGVNLSPDCDGAGNTPLHFALSMRQLYSSANGFAIATLIDAGANLNAVNSRGQTPLDLAENRYQRMLIRWDADVRKLCNGIDVMDQAGERETSEGGLYYYIIVSSGRESLEQVRNRVNSRMQQQPNCAGGRPQR